LHHQRHGHDGRHGDGEAWHDGSHDDLVFAVAEAAFVTEARYPRTLPAPYVEFEGEYGWVMRWDPRRPGSGRRRIASNLLQILWA
jgi:hypothetical protein